MTMTLPEDQGFQSWKGRVDLEIARIAGGLVSDDLPDAMYYDMYEEGFTPREAAKVVVRDAQNY